MLFPLLAQVQGENKPPLQVSAQDGSAWEGFPRARQDPQMGSSSSQNVEELSFGAVEVPIFYTNSGEFKDSLRSKIPEYGPQTKPDWPFLSGVLSQAGNPLT